MPITARIILGTERAKKPIAAKVKNVFIIPNIIPIAAKIRQNLAMSNACFMSVSSGSKGAAPQTGFQVRFVQDVGYLYVGVVGNLLFLVGGKFGYLLLNKIAKLTVRSPESLTHTYRVVDDFCGCGILIVNVTVVEQSVLAHHQVVDVAIGKRGGYLHYFVFQLLTQSQQRR